MVTKHLTQNICKWTLYFDSSERKMIQKKEKSSKSIKACANVIQGRADKIMPAFLFLHYSQ